MPSLKSSNFKAYLQNRKLQSIIGVVILTLALSYAFNSSGTNFTTLLNQLNDYSDIAKSRPTLAATIFLIIFSICCASPLPVISMLIIASGYLFGYTLAFLLTEIGALIGALLTFQYSRKLFQKQSSEDLNIPTILYREVENAGFVYALSARFMPGIPFFVMNLGQSMTNIKLFDFLAATFVGTIPTFLILINAGVHLQSAEGLESLISPGVLLSFLGIALLPIFLRGVYLLNKRK